MFLLLKINKNKNIISYTCKDENCGLGYFIRFHSKNVFVDSNIRNIIVLKVSDKEFNEWLKLYKKSLEDKPVLTLFEGFNNFVVYEEKWEINKGL